MAYLTLSTVLTFIGFQCPFIVIQFGWFVGWIYLRFYKKNTGEMVGGGDSYGDRSETFALISWFPPLVQSVKYLLVMLSMLNASHSTPIGWLGNTVYSVANKLHLIPSPGADLEAGGYSQLPGGARAEAERRRFVNNKPNIAVILMICAELWP